MTSIKHSRLLFSDFIDVHSMALLPKKLEVYGFLNSQNKAEGYKTYELGDKKDLIGYITKRSEEGKTYTNYLKTITAHVFEHETFPLPILVLEVQLEEKELQKDIKNGIEGKIWKISLDVFSYFSKNYDLFSYSRVCFREAAIFNYLAEVRISMETPELAALLEKVENYDRLKKENDRGKIGSALNVLIESESVKFYSNGFSDQQTIIKGSGQRAFVIGSIVNSRLDYSPPMYLLTYQTELVSSQDIPEFPVIEKPGNLPLLDLSYGGGQILFLLLLGSWIKHVDLKLSKLVNFKARPKDSLKKQIQNSINGLMELYDCKLLNERVSSSYAEDIVKLSNVGKKEYGGILKEVMISSIYDTITTIIEGFSNEKHISLSAISRGIIENIRKNDERIGDLTELWKSKTELLSTQKNNRIAGKMLWLTVVITIATIANVVIFLAPSL